MESINLNPTTGIGKLENRVIIWILNLVLKLTEDVYCSLPSFRIFKTAEFEGRKVLFSLIADFSDHAQNERIIWIAAIDLRCPSNPQNPGILDARDKPLEGDKVLFSCRE